MFEITRYLQAFIYSLHTHIVFDMTSFNELII
jgi:hypothetical protein